jgi:uncharacterized repeat protein (TIGR03803 family)
VNAGPGTYLRKGGVVFKLTQSGGVWSESVLHSFGNGSDGSAPFGKLIEDKSGNLYGTTQEGGADGYGSAFELALSGGAWKELVLHSFAGGLGGSDGGNPDAGLVADAAGNLYGTTYYGGSTDCEDNFGCGTVFELTLSGGKWSEKVLHSFIGGQDGSYPQGAVVLDKNGALYGTTSAGGPDNYGTVWQVVP